MCPIPHFLSFFEEKDRIRDMESDQRLVDGQSGSVWPREIEREIERERRKEKYQRMLGGRGGLVRPVPLSSRFLGLSLSLSDGNLSQIKKGKGRGREEIRILVGRVGVALPFLCISLEGEREREGWTQIIGWWMGGSGRCGHFPPFLLISLSLSRSLVLSVPRQGERERMRKIVD